MNNPLVSVVLPVYEREQYLPTAIKSIIAQTFQDYEVIVTDNSDKAALRKICESLNCAGRLRYRSNQKNLGAALNIRAALHEAKGKYVTILNDDDYLEPTFLEKLAAALEQDSTRVLAFSDHWIMDAQGKIDAMATDANSILYGRAELPPGDVIAPPKLVLEKNGVPQMASLFRKDAVAPALLSEQVIWAYDFWISCVLAGSGGRFYYLPERLTRYRVHIQMETARKAPDKNLPLIFIFQQLLDRNWFPAMRGHLEHRLAGAYYHNGRDLLWFGQLIPAREMLRKGIRVSWHPKAMIALVLSFAPRFIRQRARLSQ